MKKLSIHDLALISVLASILFICEEILTFLPNIQLTFFLIVLYSKKLGIVRTIFIVIIYSVLDNLFMGSLNSFYMIFILIGLLIIPLTIGTVFKRVNSNIGLAFLGVLYSFIYSWIFIIPNVLFLNVGFFAYLAADLIFEILLACSSFLSILLLFNPCAKIIDSLLVREYNCDFSE